MSVDLEGFENVPREERKVLSQEQFEKFIISTSKSYSEDIQRYIMAKLIKKDQESLDSLYKEIGVNSKEELVAIIEEAYGAEILQVDPKELIKNVPEEIMGMLGDLDSKIENSIRSFEDFQNLGDDIEFIDKEFNKKLMDIATEVSKYDLSQIQPESYANANFLKYINFQNTGAKLDFDYIRENRKNSYDIYISSENLKGVDLISFDSSLYKKTKEESGDWLEHHIYLNPENFDLSQYQTVIDSYSVKRKYVTHEVFSFLVNQELQENNKWLIDYAFEDLDKNGYLTKYAWKQLSPKTQLENKEYFKQMVDYCHNNYMELIDILKDTVPEILDENAENLVKIYTDSNGVIEKKFFYNAFRYFSDNYKEKFYKENKDLSLEDKVLALKCTNPKFINDNFIELFDSAINDNNYLTGLGRNLMSKLTDYEFDESVLDHILEATKGLLDKGSSYYQKSLDEIFTHLSPKNQLDCYKDFMQIGLDNNIDEKEIAHVFGKMNTLIKEENFNDVLEFSKTLSPNIAHYIRGREYVDMVQHMSDDKREEFLEHNSKDILLSLRTKYEDPKAIFEDKLSSEEREKFDSNYSKDYIEVLLDMDKKGDLDSNNVNVIIDNLPRLGKDVIVRLYNSNSDMIRYSANQLINAASTLKKEEAISLIEDTERIFSKGTIPDFVKIYKFYDNVVEKKEHVLASAINKSSNYSPELQQSGSEKAGKRIIFSDLFNIALKSNNKSLKNALDLLEKGNETYIKYLTNRDLSSLTENEKDTLKRYSDTLYTIYDESSVSKIDKKQSGKKIINSKDYIKTLDDLTKRYIGEAFPRDLSNEVLKTVIGRYDELLAGKKTIEEFKTYMEEINQKSNERHEKLEKTKLVLEPGDLIKGVRNANEILQDLFSNGIRAGEFLGTDTHTDATPLDSDHSLILPNTVRNTLAETISNTTSSGYGSFYLIIKHDPQKIAFTRDDPEYIFKSEESPKYQSSLGKNADQEALRARIKNRMNGTFEEPKLEAFSSNGSGHDHYGIRTGMSITDVDYIVVENYDKRVGYELAMNGTFIPVVDKSTNEVIFGMDEYNNIREQMQGLSYYGTDKFNVDQTAYNQKVEEKVAQLFPDGNAKESISEIDARTKREAIERKVRAAITEKLDLGFSSKITGDVTPGFIEFIDTGSTGRGTNLPGDGDFDFSVKVDKSMFDNQEQLNSFKSVLREELAVCSNDEECKLDEFNGNFRYKKVSVDGVEKPLDIDITFMQKSEDVKYSTDMAVKDRLQGIKENDPEGYKRVIANIVVAKEMLKKEGIYKKKSSDGATIEGGFGGVGVENWILQNGGSFVKAMQTFLETSEKSKNFNEFMEKYPIYDFGQNHMAKGYQHDSFIRGISEVGYTKMQEKFKEFIKELEPEIKQTQEVTMEELAKNALDQGIRTEEFNNASRNMTKEEIQLNLDKEI